MATKTSESTVTFKCPAEPRRAAEEKAETELLTVSAWLRRVVRDAVIAPMIEAPVDAGEDALGVEEAGRLVAELAGTNEIPLSSCRTD